jgi:GNAT superfamily N-acetyltransferase
MITVKRLSECTLTEAVQAWNTGFEGYFFDATMSVEAFTTRLGMEGLSPDLSLVAFNQQVPVAIVLNGVRNINGKKVSWNGGTGVALSHRGKGVGQMMMEETLKLYEKEDIDIATLEAISENSRAISLYERMGYKTIDRLLGLQQQGMMENGFHSGESKDYTIVKGIPRDVSSYPLYRSMSPWQTQWQSVRDGEAILVKNHDGECLGYAIYKRMFDSSNQHTVTVLYQCEVSPRAVDSQDLLNLMLEHVFQPRLEIRRSTFNLPVSNDLVVNRLKEAGFSVRTEQVYMIKEMK